MTDTEIPKEEIGIGSVVKVDHPITVLNPDEYFAITAIRHNIRTGQTYVGGANTCWFNAKMIVEVK